MSGTHSDPDVSVVGSGARIKGTLVSTGSVEIHGQVSGKISVQGEVFLCASSQVQADIGGKHQSGDANK